MTSIAGAQGLHASAPRSARPASTRSTTIIEPTTAPQVYDTNDAAIQALEPGHDRWRRRRPADRRLHHQRPARGLDDRRPVRGRHARALQRRPHQGQPADGVRRRRHRALDRTTARSRRWPASSCRSRTPSRSSSRRPPRAGPPAHDRSTERPPSPRPAAGAARVAHRDRQHGRRLRRARLGRRQRTGLAGGPGLVPRRRRSSPSRCPSIVEAFLVNIQLFVAAEILVLIFGLLHRDPAQPARARRSSRSGSSRPSTRTSSGRFPGLLVIFVLGFGDPRPRAWSTRRRPPILYGIARR